MSDADIFAACDVKQPGFVNQAFADHRGASRTVLVGEANIEFGGPAVARMAFDYVNWTLNSSAVGSGLGVRAANFTRRALAHLNFNNPRNLHHVESLRCNFDAVWSELQANLARDGDWLETAAEVAAIVGVGIASLRS